MTRGIYPSTSPRSNGEYSVYTVHDFIEYTNHTYLLMQCHSTVSLCHMKYLPLALPPPPQPGAYDLPLAMCVSKGDCLSSAPPLSTVLPVVHFHHHSWLHCGPLLAFRQGLAGAPELHLPSPRKPCCLHCHQCRGNCGTEHTSLPSSPL